MDSPPFKEIDMGNKHSVGDRVCREKDVFKRNSGKKHGVVSRRYSEPRKVISKDVVLGPYPELYEVTWDDGTVEKGFLPHGISAEDNQ